MTETPEAPAIPGVARHHPKRLAVDAHQWHRNGDHPADNCRMITPDPASATQFAPFLSEGEIVRYYRNPDDEGRRECGDCGHSMHDHGWIDQGALGRVVCPGDWVVTWPTTTPGLIAYFPVKPDVFAATCESVTATIDAEPPPALSPRTDPAEPAAAATAPLERAREEWHGIIADAAERAWWSKTPASTLAAHLPAIRDALSIAISEAQYAATEKPYREAQDALDGLEAEVRAKLTAVEAKAAAWATLGFGGHGFSFGDTYLADCGRDILAIIRSDEGNGNGA